MPLQEKYVNPFTDFGFKRLFGTESNKDLLIDFLNQVLPTCHQVKELSYTPTEQLGATKMDRKAIYDLYCTAPDGARFVVEVQKAPQNYFKDRSVYYSTFPIQEQAKKGFWDFRLAAVYTLGILDFIFEEDKDDDEVRHIVKLKDQHCQIFYDKLTFIYLELPKFRKTEAELETNFDKWMYVLRHLPDLEARPDTLQGPIFEKLFQAAELARFTPQEHAGYEQSLKYYRDLKNVIDTSFGEGRAKGFARGLKEGEAIGLAEGKAKGLAEGKAEGLAEGKAEEKRATVRNALQLGLDDATIARITHLPEAEVARLRRSGGGS